MKQNSFVRPESGEPGGNQWPNVGETEGHSTEQPKCEHPLPIEERTDDKGIVYLSESGKRLPNVQYEVDGREHKTDDRGEVYMSDGKYYPNAHFKLGGKLYRTDSDGNVIGKQTENDQIEPKSKIEVPVFEGRTSCRSNMGEYEPQPFGRGGVIVHFQPTSNGEWEGEAGDSTWRPDPDYIPPEKSRNPDHPYSNPDNLTWEEILKKYDIEGIEFRDGYPVFDNVSRGTVEIDDFTDDRDANFTQANEKLAKQKGCTPEDVEKWMKENNYTWHECEDCKTMQKVPNEIHANVPHSGGISVYKESNGDTEKEGNVND